MHPNFAQVGVTSVSALASQLSSASKRLSVKVSLSGYTVSSFTTPAQTAFKAAVTATLGLSDPAVVNITKVQAATSRRRLLVGSGITVSFTVVMPSAAGGSNSPAAVLASGSAFAAALATAFSAAGLPVPVPSGIQDMADGSSLIDALVINNATDVTSVIAAVTDLLAALTSSGNGDELAAAQTSMLSALVTLTDSGINSTTVPTAEQVNATVSLVLVIVSAVNEPLSAGVATLAASAVASAVGLSNGTLSANVSTTVLVVLAAVVAAPIDPTDTALADTVATALSSVAKSSASMSIGSASTVLLQVQQVQASYLDALANSTAAAPLGIAAAVNTATAVLSLVSAAPNISAAGQTSALRALGAVAVAPINVSNVGASAVVCETVTLALSGVAGSAVANNPAALATVADVLSNATASQAIALVEASAAATAAGGPPALNITTRSTNIQTLVAVSPGVPANAVSAPGSPSSFEPLPADLLSGRSASAAVVVTQFRSLTFDPYSGTGTNGSTRLALADSNGTDFVIANLSAPIRFVLPSLAALADGTRAQCQFWDPAALAYSTRGCATIPDPQPPGHVLNWVAGFNATSDAVMANAWQVTGPLVANCSAVVLDCSSSALTRFIYPNLRAPFDTPRVECNGTLSTTPKLVFTGSRCALIQPDNAFNCSWNNTAQAFTGGGCVASGQPVRCACRHRACSLA